jgi:hypothetical protein
MTITNELIATGPGRYGASVLPVSLPESSAIQSVLLLLITEPSTGGSVSECSEFVH